MAKWKCKVCKYEYEGDLPEDFKCPICKQPASAFEKIEETNLYYYLVSGCEHITEQQKRN